MYFERDVVVIFITPSYIWPPHLLLCHGGMLVKDVITSFPPPCVILCLLVIFMCCAPSLGNFSGAPLFYYWVDPCMMYLANLSHRLGWYYLLILTLDLFGSRFYVLERSIYWDALSFVKRDFWLLSSRNNKIFCMLPSTWWRKRFW